MLERYEVKVSRTVLRGERGVSPRPTRRKLPYAGNLRRRWTFEFDWSKEKENHVFKIIKAEEENSEILGLISLVNIADELRIHINLIENSNDNKGKTKKISIQKYTAVVLG